MRECNNATEQNVFYYPRHRVVIPSALPTKTLPKNVWIGRHPRKVQFVTLLPELMRIDPLIVFSHTENYYENGLRLARAKVAVKPE
jgi:hypothetical protein